jgi:hypothetical protein
LKDARVAISTLQLRVALSSDAGSSHRVGDGATSEAHAPSRRSKASASSAPDVPTAAQAEISESRLAVQWMAPLPDGGDTGDEVYPAVLFSSDAVALDEPGSGAAVVVKVLGGTSSHPDAATVRRLLLNARLQMRLTGAMGCVAAHGVCVMSSWGGHRLVAFVQVCLGHTSSVCRQRVDRTSLHTICRSAWQRVYTRHYTRADSMLGSLFVQLLQCVKR